MGGIVHFNNTLAVFPHVKLKSFFSPISVYLLVLDSSQSIYCESEIFLISVTLKLCIAPLSDMLKRRRFMLTGLCLQFMRAEMW